MKEPKLGATYRHYKGGLYRVLEVGTHTETGERLVVYRAAVTGEIWIRPLAMWVSPVLVNGEEIQRFTLLVDARRRERLQVAA